MKLLVDQVNRLKELYHLEMENNKKLAEDLNNQEISIGVFGSRDSSDYACSILNNQKAESNRNLDRINRILSECTIINNPNTNTIDLGSKFVVTINFDGKITRGEYTLVESKVMGDPRNYISTESPIGSALLGRHLDETFTYETPKDVKRNSNIATVTVEEIIRDKKLTR